MKQITNEIRARIFAAYWGSGVYHPCDRCAFEYRGVIQTSDIGQPRPRLYGDWSGGTNPEKSCESYTNWDKIKLLLIPLVDITDEDAEEVAKMALKSPHFLLEDDIKGHEVLIDEIIREDKISVGIACRCNEGYINIHSTPIAVRVEFSENDILDPTDNMQEIIDYLRSKSYDCGYGNIPSLIEVGIAINKSIIAPDDERSVATNAQ